MLTLQGRDTSRGVATLHSQMDLKWEVSQENQDTTKTHAQVRCSTKAC